MSDEKNDNWEMPKPVFRSTSGAAPKSLEDTISHSFIPNAETVEIAEDDDILGIMTSSDGDRAYQSSEKSNQESILDTEPAPETAPIPEMFKSEPIDDTDQPAAIKVTARDPAEKPHEMNGRRSDFFIYLFMVIIGAALLIAAVYYWFSPPAPVR
jgi:hypothetical protein